MTIPREALELRPESLALRQLQTRRFETTDEKRLLQAGAAVLQDLGFNIDESELGLGVIVGSKTRDARDTGQIIGAIVLGALIGAQMPTDATQRIRASIVTREINSQQMGLRITFQRTVFDAQGILLRTESLEDPTLYQEFFAKLSKAVFLEAQQL